MLFRGNFPAKLDGQGRVKIPTAHRRVFEEQYGPDLFVTSITGESVLIYPLSVWEEIEAKMLEAPKMARAKRMFLRNTSYFGQVSTMDKQGRLGIQPHLREAAGINGELAVMGNLNLLEVWDAEKIRGRMVAEPLGDDDLEELAHLGI